MRIATVALAAALAAGPAAASGLSVGQKLAPFALDDADGHTVDLAGLRDRKAVVLMFIATQCPISNDYNSRMAALAREYAAKGVAVVGINSNRQEGVAEISAHARQNSFAFPVLKDVNNVQADRFGAQVTPEVYVFDPDWTLRYHGRIDDDRSGAKVGSHDLRNALDALLVGKDVPVTETKAFGCTIKRVQ